MRSLIYLLIVFIFLSASCMKEDYPRLQTNAEGEIISLPIVWKKNLHLETPHLNGSLHYPIFFKGNPIIPMTNGTSGRLLAMIDPTDGKTLWQWDDRFVQETERILIGRHHQYENVMVYTMGSRVYGINLESGQTQWRSRNNLNRSFYSRVYGKEDDFFMFGRSDAFPDTIDQTVVFKGNIHTGKYEEYIIPKFTMDYIGPGNRIGDVTAVAPFTFESKDYLAVIWQEPFFEFDWHTYLSLWDIQREDWAYDKIIVNNEIRWNGVLLNPPVIYQDRIYMSVGNFLACHELKTGRQLWIKRFSGEIFFSNFLIEEDMLIAQNEDQFVYCLDPLTGFERWKTKGSGTSSKMSYLNGVVYFNGGASSRLHAIDIRSGKTVWRIDPKLIGNAPGEIFMGTALYTIPGVNGKKGKVISLTGNFAYCFEAYR